MRIPTGLNGFSAAIPPRRGRLSALPPFGANPGALAASFYAPPGLRPGSPLVVVLHGCTQTAEAYDRGSDWSLLADRCGFAVLFPEQARANNPNLCFNWFRPEDIRRDFGEAHSISQMVEAMAVSHAIDRSRIFVTGLSAGGAMTAVMLAAYPEIFAAGAIIAGLPYGVAASVPDALARMRGQGMPPASELAASARRASGHAGPWPRLSVWHGGADQTVAPSNAEAIVAQWRGVHGLSAAGTARLEAAGRHTRKIWSDAGGRDVIELRAVSGMGHGAPVDASLGFGEPGPFMLEAGISSSLEIARFWGIAGNDVALEAANRRSASARPVPTPRAARSEAAPSSSVAAGKVEGVIHEALRKAGLMR